MIMKLAKAFEIDYNELLGSEKRSNKSQLPLPIESLLWIENEIIRTAGIFIVSFAKLKIRKGFQK